MLSREVRIAPGYSAAIAAAAALLVHARSPAAALQALAARERPRQSSVHGWTAQRRPDGSLWYVFVQHDAHGFQTAGRSGPEPPPDVDPATIPEDDSPVDLTDKLPVAKRLADGLRLVRAHRDDATLSLLPAELGGVAAGEPGSDVRLAALYRLEIARLTLGAGCRKDYLDGFLDALRQVAPQLGGSRDVGPVRAMAAHFAADVERERGDLTLDAMVAALVELFTAAVRELDDIGVAMVSTGFLAWRPIAGDNVAALLDHLMMMCRKTRDVGLLERQAGSARERASRLREAALGAGNAADFGRHLLGCSHAAWLADSLFEHLARHRSGVSGLVTDPMFDRVAGVAEELLVRASVACVNWLEALRGAAFAVHRMDVVRRMRVAGEAAGKSWATELVQVYLYYPTCVLPLLAADDPGGTIEADAEGNLPRLGLDAKLRLLERLELIAQPLPP